MSTAHLLSEVRERCRRHGLAPNAGARRRFGRDLAELSEAQAAELLAALRTLDTAGPKLEAKALPNRPQTAHCWRPGDGIGPAPAGYSTDQAAAWCAVRAERYPMTVTPKSIPHDSALTGGRAHDPV